MRKRLREVRKTGLKKGFTKKQIKPNYTADFYERFAIRYQQGRQLQTWKKFGATQLKKGLCSKLTGEKPYEVYDINDYWVIAGTLPKGWHGGTFLIIINSYDCKVIRITHGK